MKKGGQNHPISEGSEISIAAILDAVKAEFEAVMGSPKKVQSALSRLREMMGKNPTGAEQDKLSGFLPLLAERIGPIVVPLFELFDELCLLSARPWPILKGMLSARDENLAILALKRASELADSGVLSVDLDMARFLAGRVEFAPFNRPECLSILSNIIGHMSTPDTTGKESQEISLYLHQKDYNLRCLAARVLDIKCGPLSHDLAEKILGHKHYELLADYLDYTRATHFDLLSLVNVPGGQATCISSLEKAEVLCGKKVLQEVIAGIGWPNVNLGLEVHRTVGVTIGSSFPLMVSPLEASLFKTIKEAQFSGESFIFVAHGGGAHRQGLDSASTKDRVSRFRSFNLAHASVLADIISLSPLSREQVWRIVDHMDKIVFDFTALFSAHAEECPILTDVYQAIRGHIVSELEKTGIRPDLSTDLIRLVQGFEDPKSLGEVRTLHGLKRYLHQRGLKLGFHLVDAAGATDRTVTIVIASSKRVIQISRCIDYIDFDQQMDETKFPYPVRIIIDAYTRQLVCGQEYLPGTRVFIYGNEAHYYLSYKNHPVFLRIDFSPPLQGGMIDLQYYGVSKYEIASHPDISLNAIREFFRLLDYDIVVKDTHIHARYDKERTVSLGVMCEKAEALFCLIPYLMEIDWVIGSLNLPIATRQEVTRAWTEFFALWGVLPINRMLTGNRQGILAAIKQCPTGDQEIAWEGDGAYRDRFSEGLPPDLLESVRSSLVQLGVENIILSGYGKDLGLGQLHIERLLLTPLRKAMSLGEITASPIGFNRTDQELFKRQHEAESFAEILASDEDTVAASAVLAQLVIPLEQALGFKTTGSLNGQDVQRALIPLCGAAINLFVLRDPPGIIRLALFTLDSPLYLWRADKSLKFHSNARVDGNEFTLLLRQSNYPAPDVASVTKVDSKGVKTIRDLFSRENPLPRPGHFAGEKVIEGQKASPGRVVGQAIFGTEAITPEDLEGKILVAPSIRPEDYPYLLSSAGVVSTGGGILSHAGLTAVQLRKPALIIQAQWIRSREGRQRLLCTSIEYREEKKDISGCRVMIRRDMRRHSILLREKDLVILDSEEGTLRILGQDIQCLGFHEEFRHLCEAGKRLSVAKDEKKILVLRGRRLRSLHQIERLLDRLTDPMLGRHAVHEILMTEFLSSSNGGQGEKARLLSIILNNQNVGKTSLEYLRDLFKNLRIRYNRLVDQGFHIIQSSNDLYEILALRLEILRLRLTIERASACTDICGLDSISPDSHLTADIDRMVRRRLKFLREGLSQKLYAATALGGTNIGLHHLLRQIERLDLVLETPPELRAPIGLINSSIILKEKTSRQDIQDMLILWPEDGGIELFPLVGWKAANLAEADRLLDKAMVPQWFAVTNRALEEMMDQTIKSMPGQFDESGKSLSLRSSINSILSRDGLSAGQTSQEILQLWEDITLPHGLEAQVASAYRRIIKDFTEGSEDAQGLHEPFVAVRSSALEEDTELAARAGEFDTFLFIRGEMALLYHLKKAFSSLWTERAIHNRRVLGVEKEDPGGGVIIQRMVHSRVSGVMQTVNIAEGNFREMVINAGWGLGQGIVSGTVSADLVLVTKEGIEEGLPLRFRYITAAKEDQIVYDKDSGMGTVRAKTLYYQRLRPALEYSELNDLVRTAKRLEAAYGYPLDIEYCFEGQKLRILQVRPIATSMAILNETIRRYPLTT
jgi:phosphohistidine swiveling domain-containing protein